MEVEIKLEHLLSATSNQSTIEVTVFKENGKIIDVRKGTGSLGNSTFDLEFKNLLECEVMLLMHDDDCIKVGVELKGGANNERDFN